MDSEPIVTPEVQPPPAAAPDMDAVRAYFVGMQADLKTRVTAIEQFLGFIEGTEALGTRVAKLEGFVGLK